VHVPDVGGLGQSELDWHAFVHTYTCITMSHWLYVGSVHSPLLMPGHGWPNPAPASVPEPLLEPLLLPELPPLLEPLELPLLDPLELPELLPLEPPLVLPDPELPPELPLLVWLPASSLLEPVLSPDEQAGMAARASDEHASATSRLDLMRSVSSERRSMRCPSRWSVLFSRV
jgi:hypothetical protein